MLTTASHRLYLSYKQRNKSFGKSRQWLVSKVGGVGVRARYEILIDVKTGNRISIDARHHMLHRQTRIVHSKNKKPVKRICYVIQRSVVCYIALFKGVEISTVTFCNRWIDKPTVTTGESHCAVFKEFFSLWQACTLHFVHLTLQRVLISQYNTLILRLAKPQQEAHHRARFNNSIPVQ